MLRERHQDTFISGTGTMVGKEPATELHTIAALFEAHIHLVASADNGIISDVVLAGKHESFG